MSGPKFATRRRHRDQEQSYSITTSSCKLFSVALQMAARRLIPLLDRVLVQRVEPVTKSASGLLLPETAVSKVNEGLVLAVGPGKRNKDGDLTPVGVKEGDKVLLPEYGGSVIKLGGSDSKELFLFRDEEILGILKD